MQWNYGSTPYKNYDDEDEDEDEDEYASSGRIHKLKDVPPYVNLQGMEANRSKARIMRQKSLNFEDNIRGRKASLNFEDNIRGRKASFDDEEDINEEAEEFIEMEHRKFQRLKWGPSSSFTF